MSTYIARKTKFYIKPLSAKPTKWLNILKQFVGKLSTNYLSMSDHFVELALKGLRISSVNVAKSEGNYNFSHIY